MYVPKWKQLVIGAEDSRIKFWDFFHFSDYTPHITCVKTLSLKNSYVENLVVIPEANCLINTNVTPKLTIWNLATDEIMVEINGSSKEESGEAMMDLVERKN